MCSPCGSRAAFQRLLVADALALLSVTAEAAKVELDPSNWGDEAGQDCVSCHTKSSPGLTQQWQESAHASGGVNCMDCPRADASEPDAMEHEGQIIATVRILAAN
jgi:hydroxylamine dehydrogenase